MNLPTILTQQNQCHPTSLSNEPPNNQSNQACPTHVQSNPSGVEGGVRLVGRGGGGLDAQAAADQVESSQVYRLKWKLSFGTLQARKRHLLHQQDLQNLWRAAACARLGRVTDSGAWVQEHGESSGSQSETVFVRGSPFWWEDPQTVNDAFWHVPERPSFGIAPCGAALGRGVVAWEFENREAVKVPRPKSN